jgi:hypothetical protein
VDVVLGMLCAAFGIHDNGHFLFLLATFFKKGAYLISRPFSSIARPTKQQQSENRLMFAAHKHNFLFDFSIFENYWHFVAVD